MGEGGCRPFNFKNMIFTYGLGWWPEHVPTTWRGFWVHTRNAMLPMWGLGAKMDQKPKAKHNEIELSFFHPSVHLDELIILSNVKIGWKKAELCPFKVGAKVASSLILSRKLTILAIFFELWTFQICLGLH